MLLKDNGFLLLSLHIKVNVQKTRCKSLPYQRQAYSKEEAAA